MKNTKKMIGGLMVTTIIFLVATFSANAQILRPVQWSYAANRISKMEAVVLIKATIDGGWHIYSANQEDGGPVKTSFVFSPAKDFQIVGKIAEPKPLIKFEETFNMQVKYFENSVTFRQKIRLRSAHPCVKGKLSFMVCNDQKCLPPEEVDFSIPIK